MLVIVSAKKERTPHYELKFNIETNRQAINTETNRQAFNTEINIQATNIETNTQQLHFEYGAVNDKL